MHKRHQKRNTGRKARKLALPSGIERCAGQADQPAAKCVGKDREYDHTPRRASNMWDRVKGNLPSFGRGHVSPKLRHERMRGFVARRREEKDDIPDYAEG